MARGAELGGAFLLARSLWSTLPPGVYTAQLSGVGGTTGDGVVEVYEVP